MSLSTEYRGYEIRYDQNGDVWRCYAADFSHLSLAKVKAKIDKLHLAIRKAAAFDCLFLGTRHGKPDPVPSRAIDYKAKRERNRNQWKGGDQPEFLVTHHVAVMKEASRFGSEPGSKGKSWQRLGDLAPLGPETDATLAKVAECHAEVVAAEARRAEAWKLVPRIEVEDLGDLEEAVDARLEET